LLAGILLFLKNNMDLAENTKATYDDATVYAAEWFSFNSIRHAYRFINLTRSHLQHLCRPAIQDVYEIPEILSGTVRAHRFNGGLCDIAASSHATFNHATACRISGIVLPSGAIARQNGLAH
jgi:hypothetical protein